MAMNMPFPGGPGPTMGPQGAPGQGPPAAPPGPPPMAPPPPPPMASPQPNLYSDLSVSMPPHWQLIDVASRNIQAGLQTGGFYQDPPTYAALKEVHSTLLRLISAYSEKDHPPMGGSSAERGAPGENDMATADNAPEPSPVDSTPEDSGN